MTRQHLIEILAPGIIRAGNTEAAARAALENATLAELHNMYYRQAASGAIKPAQQPAQQPAQPQSRSGDAALQESQDRILQIQAERAADRAIHELRTQQYHAPRMAQEAAHLERTNRTVFLDAAKTFNFSNCEANLSILVQALGELSVYSIGQLLSANGASLVPASAAELQEREAERIDAHNKFLLNADTQTLHKIAKTEAETRRTLAVNEETERQIKHREQLDAQHSFPPLPLTDQHSQPLDSNFFKKLSNTNITSFRNFIRKYGAAQITSALRTRV